VTAGVQTSLLNFHDIGYNFTSIVRKEHCFEASHKQLFQFTVDSTVVLVKLPKAATVFRIALCTPRRSPYQQPLKIRLHRQAPQTYRRDNQSTASGKTHKGGVITIHRKACTLGCSGRRASESV
jgi:hypothetical protein